MSFARIVHVAEATFLTVLACMAVARVLPAIPQHPQLAVFLTAEVLGAFLAIVQRQGVVAAGLRPFLLAFCGTGASLLVVPDGLQLAPDYVSTALILGGASLSIVAKLSLRRSFGLVAANRGVKSGGLYRLVRHPMYMAYMINHVGFLLLYLSPWNVAVHAMTWILLWMRTTEEEKVLRKDPAYQEYASKVRARLVPGLL